LQHTENSIVLHKKEGNNGLNIVHRRTAPLGACCTVHQCTIFGLLGRYGRYIVKGYRE